MPSKGHDKAKGDSANTKPIKSKNDKSKIAAGSENPVVSPGGWQGPPNRDKD
jgi:hypothetical protein